MAAPERIGPYTILGTLGEGGMGVVYHARREGLDHDVALKVLRPELRSDPLVEARFQREAKAAASVAGHPGLVAVHDAGSAGGVAWCAMDFVQGRSLEEVIAGGDLPPEEAAQLIEQVARALDHIHGLGILHRDLKPSNVLVTAEGRALVTDFGLASVRPSGPEVTRLTRSNLLIGTPSYMPPEQVSGDTVDPTADVYAAGATLYEALCGRPPHHAMTVVETLESVLHGTVTPPRALVPSVPPALERIALHCLERDPGNRYPTALALAEDLARYRRGEPVTAAAPSGAARLAGATRRHTAWLLTAGVLAAAAAGGWALWGWSSEQERTAERAEAAAEQAGTAADLDAAYAAMALRTLETLRTLEDDYHGVPLTEEEREAALAQIERVRGEVEAAHPGSTLPQAWHGLAMVYAGQTKPGEQLLDAACAQATDPFAFVLRARARLAAWFKNIRVPGAMLVDGRAMFEPEPETDALAQARLQAADDLRAAAAMPAWRSLARGHEYEAFIHAIAAHVEGRPLDAIAHLESLAADSPLEQEAQLMLGQMLYRLERFEEAARAFTRCGRRGWTGPLGNAGAAWQCHAATLQLGSEAQGQAYLKAREAYVKLLRMDRDDAFAGVGLAEATLGVAKVLVLQGRDATQELHAVVTDAEHAKGRLTGDNLLRMRFTLATAHMLRAEQARTRNEDQRPHLRRAIAESRWVVARKPNQAVLWRRLGTDLGLLAGLEEGAGADGLDLFNEALVAYEQSIRLAPEVADTQIGLALIRLHRGSALARRREDPRPDWDACATALARAAELANESKQLTRLDLMLHHTRARWLKRTREDTAAVWKAAHAAAGRALGREPKRASLYGDRAAISMHWAERTRRDAGDPTPHFAAAVADLDHALELRPDQPTWLGNRASARLQLAFLARHDPKQAEAHLAAALEDCDAALALEADGYIAHAVKIDVLERTGRDRDALAAVEAALRALPGHREFTALRARLRTKLGR